MDPLVLKSILLFFMGLVPIVFGLAPLKLYMFLTKRNKGQLGRTSSIIISLISCFCGGVILGVCLLEMLPETNESFEELKRKTGWHSNYPYVELFTGIGLFVVYLAEELIGTLFGLRHDHSDEGTKEAFEHIEDDVNAKKPSTPPENDDSSQRPITPATLSSMPLDPVAEKELRRHQRKAIVNALTFVLALVLHTSLEGFAFGIQDSVITLSSLFFGIITHKALISFSVGMSLTKSLNHNKKIVVILIVVLALFSPIGGCIGIFVKSGQESVTKTTVTLIFNCFSIGTFLYISFFEILAPERQNDHPKLFQWFFCVVGFLTMAGFMALGGEHSHEESR